MFPIASAVSSSEYQHRYRAIIPQVFGAGGNYCSGRANARNRGCTPDESRLAIFGAFQNA